MARLIKDVESKVKLTKTISVGILIMSVILVITGFYFAYKFVDSQNKNVYVLDNGVPVMAIRVDATINREIERKSHIDGFHKTFFTIIPDKQFIDDQMDKALAMIDESGLREFVNLKEKGLYTQILSSNTILSVKTDSIKLNQQQNTFTYFGKQFIERRTTRIVRNLVTEGNIKDMPRSRNNPHGVMIFNWKTIDNSDIERIDKNY
jgi:conjugative transposon TraK protein